MQHARHTHIVNINQFAGRLGGEIDPRHGLPDDPIGVGGFYHDIVRKLEANDVVSDQLAIAQAAVVVGADQPIVDGQFAFGQLEPLGGETNQILPCLRRGLAQWHGGDLDGLAGDGRPLVRRTGRIAEHHDDARERDIEFVRDDLGECGTDAGAEIDVAVERSDDAIRRDLDKGFEGSVAGSRGMDHGQRSGQPVLGAGVR